MECTRPDCPFLRHPNAANNGGAHCCAACKRFGGHGPACKQISLKGHKKRKTTKATTTTQATTTTKATTTTQATTTTKATTTTVYPWDTVVRHNSVYIQPVYSTATKAYFQMLTGGSLRTSLDCSGVLVSAGNNGAVGAIGNGGAGGNSGYMTTIDICANTTYNVLLNTNSSITYGASIFSSGTIINSGTMNSASGGRAGSNGDDNTFGKGKGGQKSDVPYVSYSGSGYGAGGGGISVDNTYPSSGGGGGFDPNGYYGLMPPITIPVSDMTSNGVVGIGKPPVLFLEVTKP